MALMAAGVGWATDEVHIAHINRSRAAVNYTARTASSYTLGCSKGTTIICFVTRLGRTIPNTRAHCALFVVEEQDPSPPSGCASRFPVILLDTSSSSSSRALVR